MTSLTFIHPQSIEKIANICKGELINNIRYPVKGITSALHYLGEKDYIVFADNEKYLRFLLRKNAKIIIISKKLYSEFSDNKKIKDATLIMVNYPTIAYNNILKKFFPSNELNGKGVHNRANIEDDVITGRGVFVDYGTTIKKNVRIGNNTRISCGVFIGNNVIIGKSCKIYPNVVIYDNVVIGNNVEIHANTTLGVSPFSFGKGQSKKIRHYPSGKLIIEDNVEIGSNVSISKSSHATTRIKKNTKIDSLVYIGHNSMVGKNNLIMGQSGLAGYVKIGNDNKFMGQTAISQRVTVGSEIIILGKSGINKNIDEPGRYFGTPAKKLSRVADIEKKSKTFEGALNNYDINEKNLNYIKLRDIIREILSVSEEKILPIAFFVEDLGADSLDLTELIQTIECEFDMSISDEEASKIDTVGDAWVHISNKLCKNEDRTI